MTDTTASQSERAQPASADVVERVASAIRSALEKHVGTSAAYADEYECAKAAISAMGVSDEVVRLREALAALLDRYTILVNSGDAGFWDPEEEDEVKLARQALNSAPESR
jgi:hypothetical protein